MFSLCAINARACLVISRVASSPHRISSGTQKRIINNLYRSLRFRASYHSFHAHLFARSHLFQQTLRRAFIAASGIAPCTRYQCAHGSSRIISKQAYRLSITSSSIWHQNIRHHEMAQNSVVAHNQHRFALVLIIMWRQSKPPTRGARHHMAHQQVIA